MLNSDDFPQLYRRTSEKTLEQWNAHSGIGQVRDEAFYDPHKLAITSGIQPALTPPLTQLLQELHQLAENDPRADVMPLSGLHFTFFAITMPQYLRSDIAAVDPELLSIFAEHAKNLTVSVRNLQLVALPNQLLIAGTPERNSLQAKEAFARRLIDSPWRDKLRERHGDIPLPPPFWHSTLVRYQAQFLPERFRNYFQARQAHHYGDVSAEVKLAFTNYNWTEVFSCP
ncbi:hypothetical protein RHD99_10445 [Buttiauxella selenatireducens]|uniref:Uncharacterized protein n=1 Tax=Buttiauxella selenatireducens TaxID=3073902 RepID=A0ABY9SFM0_9ENTR|nr:hypothetical protein [Buttiauxella sp. R73]WMY76308.1 hypothetical protein RHD99_10445 [Buttiauxella sp. R73]